MMDSMVDRFTDWSETNVSYYMCIIVLQMATATKQSHGETELVYSEQYGYKKDFRTALPQFIAVSVKNLLLIGNDANYTWILYSAWNYLSE